MKYFVLLSVIVCGLCSGCSFFNTTRQIVAVNIEPADANAIINGLSYPGGAVYADVSRSREVLIEVWKDKYLTEKYVIPFQLSSTGVMDACGAILIIPAFGLFSSGAWELKENVVHIKLKPDPMAPKTEVKVGADKPETTEVKVTEPVEIAIEKREPKEPDMKVIAPKTADTEEDTPEEPEIEMDESNENESGQNGPKEPEIRVNKPAENEVE